jgi:deoxyribodipyrimidine photo-lyase
MAMLSGNPPLTDSGWPATRAEGLARLERFVPRAGMDYSQHRNYDLGPENRDNVSLLSPYLRHRLITEAEVVDAVLARHAYPRAEKFIQEVFWRTYWKGWLEMRPDVWRRYQVESAAIMARLRQARTLLAAYQRAVSGHTGIDCFDAWSHELIDRGYLHNHARLWFASIWIFTLNLPWQLGADFFLRHLLDGDPASNTLSWRWVAGLQTAGKHYLAKPDNIHKFTAGRFTFPQELNLNAAPPTCTVVDHAKPLPQADRADVSTALGLLLTEEDLHPESLPIPPESVRAVAGFVCTRNRSTLEVSPAVLAFARAAVRDGIERAQRHFHCAAHTEVLLDNVEDIVGWAKRAGVDAVVSGYAPVGSVEQQFWPLKKKLAEQGTQLLQVRRRWDEQAWPFASKGFFTFKERIPELLADRQDSAGHYRRLMQPKTQP